MEPQRGPWEVVEASRTMLGPCNFLLRSSVTLFLFSFFSGPGFSLLQLAPWRLLQIPVALALLSFFLQSTLWVLPVPQYFPLSTFADCCSHRLHRITSIVNVLFWVSYKSHRISNLADELYPRRPGVMPYTLASARVVMISTQLRSWLRSVWLGGRWVKPDRLLVMNNCLCERLVGL
jgi:hypothetical protein